MPMLTRADFSRELSRAAAMSDTRGGYRLLLQLLQDLLNGQTQGQALHFTSLFTHLHAVCRQRAIDARSIDDVRRRARTAVRGEQAAEPEQLLADCRTLADFAAALASPADAVLPQGAQPARLQSSADASSAEGIAGIRAVVTERQGTLCRVVTEHGDTWRIVAAEPLAPTLALLTEGTAVRLLDCTVTDEALRPNYIIVEPDYLTDISTLASCSAYYGHEPQNYLLRLFEPRSTTSAILMGNLAGEFLDTIVHAPDGTPPEVMRRQALTKAFADAPLEYLTLSTHELNDLKEKAATQFKHIYEGVHDVFARPETGLQREALLLEPTLLCPALGLRGRLDVMSADGHSVVELKSGRAVESVPPRQRPEHAMQMYLYAEMMRRNFGVSVRTTNSYLWYSAYPLLIPLYHTYEALTEALNLRNRIVAMMRFVAQGGMRRILPTLTPTRLNTARRDDRFYHRFFKPRLEALCGPLGAMDEVTKAYFCAFAGFLARELWAGKTTDARPFSTRGFARTWQADAESKMAEGEMLAGLRYKPLETNASEQPDSVSDSLMFSLDAMPEEATPNFRSGDAVILYRRDSAADTAVSRPLYRAFVAELTADTLRLRLQYPQSHRLFEDTAACYAIEHDHMDVAVTNGFGGLWWLAATDPRRRELLLGQRAPRQAAPHPVSHSAGKDVDDIVSRALAAQDYFLLVGPPGTGKTNVALRALTLNYLADNGSAGALLLTAYTNRAVDEICGMLEQAAVGYVRIGSTHSCAEAYRPRLLSEIVKGRGRSAMGCLLNEVPVVVGTVLTLSRRLELFRIKKFGLAVIDEASQILEPQLLTLLCATGEDGMPVVPRFVMVGDHKQLPAVVMQDEKQCRVADTVLYNIGLRDLRSSLFERLHRLALRDGCEALTATLTRQGRMHPDIADYASRSFYGGVLSAVPLPHQKGMLGLTATDDQWEGFVASTRLGFVDVAAESSDSRGDGGAAFPAQFKTNDAEARAVACIVRAVCALYQRAEGAFDVGERVGVIVPFRAQINRVRRALVEAGVDGAGRMTIDTVECYQGSQRDVIVYCTTVTRPWQLAMISEPVDVGGTAVDRKLNVAATRARRQFFLVGNSDALHHSPLYTDLIRACTPFGPAKEHARSVHE